MEGFEYFSCPYMATFWLWRNRTLSNLLVARRHDVVCFIFPDGVRAKRQLSETHVQLNFLFDELRIKLVNHYLVFITLHSLWRSSRDLRSWRNGTIYIQKWTDLIMLLLDSTTDNTVYDEPFEAHPRAVSLPYSLGHYQPLLWRWCSGQKLGQTTQHSNAPLSFRDTQDVHFCRRNRQAYCLRTNRPTTEQHNTSTVETQQQQHLL